MEIKVYGPGCARCHELYQLVMDFCAEREISADVDYITDVGEIASAGIMSTPALVVDGKLLASGRVPRKKELERWLGVEATPVDRWWTKKKGK